MNAPEYFKNFAFRIPRSAFFLGLALAMLLPQLTGCASAVRDRRVLIMNFENGVPGSEQTAPYSISLAEMMTACLANSPRVAVLDRQDLAGLISRATGPKQISWRDVGRRAGADYVIVGSIAKLDRNYLINARLLSVSTGVIVKGSAVTRYARREEDIYPAVQAICYVLSYQLKYLAEMYDAMARGETLAPAAAPAPVPAAATSTPLPPAPAGPVAPTVTTP